MLAPSKLTAGPSSSAAHPHPWRSSASRPPSAPWPQVTPALGSIMERGTICHYHHGSTSSVLSPIIHLKGRAGSQVALGSSREDLCSVPLSQVGCGAPSCPDGWVPSLSGHHSPHAHVTRSHPSVFTQCPDEHLKLVLKGLCTYSLSLPQDPLSRTGAEHSSGTWEPSDLEPHREWSLTKACEMNV